MPLRKQSVQWAHLAEDKGLAKVERIVEKKIMPTAEGEQYVSSNLPETQILAVIHPGAILADLQGHPAFKIGFGQLRKKGLIHVDGSTVIKNETKSTNAEEFALRNPVSGEHNTRELIKRGILVESETVRYAISITLEGIALVTQGLDLREEIGTLIWDQILSGAWKTANLRKYDVKKLPKTVYPGKSHPYPEAHRRDAPDPSGDGFYRDARGDCAERILELRRALPASGSPGP